MQEISLNDLAKATVILQSIISAIENDSVKLWIERAKIIAIALKSHPAVLMFLNQEIKNEANV